MTYTGWMSLIGTWHVIAASIVGLAVWLYAGSWVSGLCAFGVFLLWGLVLVLCAFWLETDGGN